MTYDYETAKTVGRYFYLTFAIDVMWQTISGFGSPIEDLLPKSLLCIVCVQ